VTELHSSTPWDWDFTLSHEVFPPHWWSNYRLNSYTGYGQSGEEHHPVVTKTWIFHVWPLSSFQYTSSNKNQINWTGLEKNVSHPDKHTQFNKSSTDRKGVSSTLSNKFWTQTKYKCESLEFFTCSSFVVKNLKTISLLLWINKAKAKDKIYMRVSVLWKTTT
jgi:hypothetical protein